MVFSRVVQLLPTGWFRRCRLVPVHQLAWLATGLLTCVPPVAAHDYTETFDSGSGGWSGGTIVRRGGVDGGAYLESTRNGYNAPFEPVDEAAREFLLGNLADKYGDTFRLCYFFKAVQGNLGWSHEIRMAGSDDTRWSYQLCLKQELPGEWTRAEIPFDASWNEEEAVRAGWVRKRGRGSFAQVVQACGAQHLGLGASGDKDATYCTGLDDVSVLVGPLPELPITTACGYNADLDNDGDVDKWDLKLLLSSFTGSDTPYDPWHPPAGCPFIPDPGERDRVDFAPGSKAFLPPDFNRDGYIDLKDIKLFQAKLWGDAHAASAPPVAPALPSDDYLGRVRLAMDTMIEWGRDRYGPQETPLFAAIVMQDTLECPIDPIEYPTTRPRAVPGRSFWRSPASANQYFDQAMFVAMDAMTEISGDEKYRQAVMEALRFNLNVAVDKRGMPLLGGHTRWNLYEDQPAANGDYHEVWHLPMAWSLWHEADPAKAQAYFDKIWQWHVVDKQTGETNRHADGNPGWSFTLCDGTLLGSWALMYSKAHDAEYLERCRKVAGYHWARRNTDTSLFPASGGTYGIGRNRHDTTQFETTTMALVHFILEAGLLTGDDQLLEMGRAVLDSYAKYGWDSERKLFYGRLTLEGKPVEPDAERGCVTGHLDPVGYLPMWVPTLGYWERPLVTAQTYAWAAESIDRDAYLPTALRFADVMERAWNDRYAGLRDWYELRDRLRPFDLEFPVQGTRRSIHAPTGAVDSQLLAHYRTGGYATQAPYGLFAEHYGRAIQFFLTIHRLTGEQKWLDLAVDAADEAVANLWRGNIFVGHVEKVSCENLDQVGLLMVALLQLEHRLAHHQVAIEPFF